MTSDNSTVSKPSKAHRGRPNSRFRKMLKKKRDSGTSEEEIQLIRDAYQIRRQLALSDQRKEHSGTSTGQQMQRRPRRRRQKLSQTKSAGGAPELLLSEELAKQRELEKQFQEVFGKDPTNPDELSDIESRIDEEEEVRHLGAN